MKIQTILAAAVLVFGAAYSNAGTIPYSNIGTVAPEYSLTATATGDVDGYYVGYSALDTDQIEMYDATSGVYSSYYFNDKAGLVYGAEADFGSVNKGDDLIFILENESENYQLSSDPSYSDDGLNHTYVTAFGGDSAIPAGTYLGFEDLSKNDPVQWADFDYNDDQIVVTNVTANPVPEPGSFFLLGSGLVGLIQFGRRKLRS